MQIYNPTVISQLKLKAIFGNASTYAQTLFNTVLALVQWSVVDAEERVFLRMQLKRLIDAQIALRDLYIDE
jgi:hypothetical protein